MKVNVFKRKPQEEGFTVVEVLVSLFVITILLQVASTVIISSGGVNRRTTLNTTSSSVVFDKIQDYINISYDNIPLGDVDDNFLVEDFSAVAENAGLKNASARVYVEPLSEVVNSTITTTESFSQDIDADTAYTNGGEIASVGRIDPGNQNRRDNRIRNNNYGDYTYNRNSPSANHPMVAIDLGSPTAVDTIRINWYYEAYGSSNFRIEGNNNNSSSGWTTVVSGLSDNIPSGSNTGSHPQDIPVGGASFRYWRMFNVTGSNWATIAISEMEAFVDGAGDVVEERNGGVLQFNSSDVELMHDGSVEQKVGIKFNGIGVDQGTTIDNAYIQFKSDSTDLGAVVVQIKGYDVDSAPQWISNNDVSNALASSATTATVVWDIPPWPGGDMGPAQLVNVTSIVQEIVNRGGWDNGNDLSFIFSHISGSSHREGDKTPPPELTIEWSVSTTVPGGDSIYDDVDGDGYADNPTLIKVTVQVDYDAFGDRKKSQYTTYIRKNGIGN